MPDASSPTPVVSIGGKLDVDNNGLFEFCSDQGGIAVGDVVDLQTNADLENCGSLVAGGAVTGTPVAPTCDYPKMRLGPT